MNRPIARCRKAALAIVSSRILGDVGATASVFPRRLVAATTTVVVLSLPVLSIATPDVGEKGNGWSKVDERYLVAYEDCWKAFKEDCGANLVDDNRANPLPDARISESTERIQRWLNPPEPTVASSTSLGVAPSASVATSVAPAPSVVQCESGGDYGANTGNGFYGGYQFDSGTWDAYGDPAYGEASEAPPAVQDAAAAKVPYDAWPNC